MKKILLGVIFMLLSIFPAMASQHDYVLADNPGAAFRADLNSALQAIVTNNSAATEPATTFSNMWWYDTSTGLLKRRNNANDAWISVGLEAADTDGTFAANSDSKVPTQKAAKTYVDTLDAANVKTTGAQTVAGVKTFSSSPIVPTPSTDYQSATKKYVDDSISAAATEFSHVEIFTSSGTWTAPTGVTVVFLTGVAGGGGGHYNDGGYGGGAGEAVVRRAYPVTPGSTYTVTVGAAGVGGTSGDTNGSAGGNSVFDSLTLTGGSDGDSGTGGNNTASRNASNQSGGSPSFGGGNGAAGPGSGVGGGGGARLFGPGGGGGSHSPGTDGQGFGSGGGEAGDGTSNGGAGKPGFWMLEY